MLPPDDQEHNEVLQHDREAPLLRAMRLKVTTKASQMIRFPLALGGQRERIELFQEWRIELARLHKQTLKNSSRRELVHP